MALGAACTINLAPTIPTNAKTIGASGGTVATSDSSASLSVPAGALASDTSIGVTPATGSPGPGAVGQVYDLSPDGQTFQQPVTLTLHYNPAELGGADPTQLKVATFSLGSWSAVPSTVDTSAQTVVASISHFSPWSLIVASTTTLPDGGTSTGADAGASSGSSSGSGSGVTEGAGSSSGGDLGGSSGGTGSSGVSSSGSSGAGTGSSSGGGDFGSSGGSSGGGVTGSSSGSSSGGISSSGGDFGSTSSSGSSSGSGTGSGSGGGITGSSSGGRAFDAGG